MWSQDYTDYTIKRDSQIVNLYKSGITQKEIVILVVTTKHVVKRVIARQMFNRKIFKKAA